MLRRPLIGLIAILAIGLFSLPVLADGTRYFDTQGNAIDKAQYDQLMQRHTATIAPILRDGFSGHKSRIADPIKLRQKRLAQWERYRALHK